MAEKRKCFEHFSDEEIKKKRKETTPKATIKNNEKWDRVFRAYLEESEAQTTEYWYYPDEELDLILSRFWFDVRTQKQPLNEEEKIQILSKNGDPYPHQYIIACLRNLRNSLSRCLAERGKNINLTTDENFRLSQKSFKDACKELKQLGKGNVNSCPEISHSGNG